MHFKIKYVNIFVTKLQRLEEKIMVSVKDDDCSNLKTEIESDFASITPIIFNSLTVAQQTVPECLATILSSCGFKNGKYPVELEEKVGQVKRQFKAHLMRAATQILLQSHGVTTKAVNGKNNQKNPIDWERNILSNNGIAGTYAGRNYKILKALWTSVLDETSGEYVRKISIPLPGDSKARRTFYRQSHCQQFLWDLWLGGDVKIPKYNALYLWDDPTPSTLNLYLACPKWCDDYNVEAYFIAPILHPLLTMKSDITPGEIIEDIELSRIELDLDLNLTKSELEDESISDESDEGNDDESDKSDNLPGTN